MHKQTHNVFAMRPSGGRRQAWPLMALEHDGTLVVVGMTTSEGARLWRTNNRATTLYSVGRKDPDHDAVMRIGSEAPRRRTHSAQRHESHGSRRDPATSNRHRRPVTSVTDRAETVGCPSPRTSLQCAGRRDDAVRHHALAHEPPQGDQQLARQGDDHRLARAAGVLGASFETTAPRCSPSGTGGSARRVGSFLAAPEHCRIDASPFSRRLVPLSSGEPVSPPLLTRCHRRSPHSIWGESGSALVIAGRVAVRQPV